MSIDASSKHWQISGAGSEHWQISGAGSAARTAKLQLLRPVYILAAVGAWLFAATLFFMTIKTAERVAEGPTSARRVFFTCLGLGLLRSP